jgi:tRNA(fMet)-specific endonuclease VapC
VFVCSIVKAEMYAGAERSNDPAKSRQRQDTFLSQFVSLPFDDRCADVYGRIRADLTRRGQIIGANDMCIASVALAHGLTIVTHNLAEFTRIPNLGVEDWE